MAKFVDKVTALKTQSVTISIVGIGNADEFAGTISDVGDDYVELDNGADQPKTLIPFAAIAAVAHR
ncbi:MAG TPA: hypothetical protein VFF06_31830 [Polyangia bacterium]|nr:hypothetical protein [Polyangia bacterium]